MAESIHSRPPQGGWAAPRMSKGLRFCIETKRVPPRAGTLDVALMLSLRGIGSGTIDACSHRKNISPAHARAETARQLLNDEERKILEAMESELGRPLTEEEERLALEPGPVIEQPRPSKGATVTGRVNRLALPRPRP